MSTPTDSTEGEDRAPPVLAAAVVAAATVGAYSGTLHAPFVYDDQAWITGHPVAGGAAGAATGRPLLAFSFALNRAAGGLGPVGYHLANIAIHVCAALVLLGIVRRTLALMPASFPAAADRLLPAFAAALLWALHPVNTEAVTYVSQRSESLMGLLYFVALYGFIRGAAPGRHAAWLGLSAAACALGMTVKETMVSAPLVILLFDRTFISGSLRGALTRRGAYYGALGACWVLLGVLLAGASPRGVGYGLGYSGWSYGVVESWVVAHYLLLSVWPFPLVFDYGTELVGSLREVVPWASVTAAATGAAVLGLLRRSAGGFAWAAFLLVLAPSSSVVPVAFQPMAEHRLYVPLAALAALAAAGAWRLFGRRSTPILVLAAAFLGTMSYLRNADYRDPVVLWSDTVKRVPDNERARLALGEALLGAGRFAESAEQYGQALRIAPGDGDARMGLAASLLRSGLAGEAEAQMRRVAPPVRDQPGFHLLLGRVLEREGRRAEAAEEYRRAAEIDPRAVP